MPELIRWSGVVTATRELADEIAAAIAGRGDPGEGSAASGGAP